MLPSFRISRVTVARRATVTAAQSEARVSFRITSCTCCVRPQMPGVGVTGPDSAAALLPPALTARSSKVWAVSLVIPVTV